MLFYHKPAAKVSYTTEQIQRLYAEALANFPIPALKSSGRKTVKLAWVSEDETFYSENFTCDVGKLIGGYQLAKGALELGCDSQGKPCLSACFFFPRGKAQTKAKKRNAIAGQYDSLNHTWHFSLYV